jgi:dienelactone hydrolase
MKYYLLTILLNLFFMDAFTQKTITFNAQDHLTVTADFYEAGINMPFMVLFHQANYSRGEFKETAPKLNKMGYNCLAVDLRSGNEVNYIKNNTAALAREKKMPVDYLSALADMKAAIDYAYQKKNKPIVIFGSSYSASLCLVLAKNNPKIKAVIAFSPGEYFDTRFNVRDSIAGLNIPIFVAVSEIENAYMKELFSKVNHKYLTVFQPKNDAGVHGSKALWDNNPSHNDYWLALMQFIEEIK